MFSSHFNQLALACHSYVLNGTLQMYCQMLFSRSFLFSFPVPLKVYYFRKFQLEDSQNRYSNLMVKPIYFLKLLQGNSKDLTESYLFFFFFDLKAVFKMESKDCNIEYEKRFVFLGSGGCGLCYNPRNKFSKEKF